MAAVARASAHISSCPESSEATGVESLALQACDDIDSLHEVRRAYAGLEKLIASQAVTDTEEIHPTRTELSALVRVVNDELQRRIDKADTTVQALRASLGEGGLQ
jgi:hypothetical protein